MARRRDPGPTLFDLAPVLHRFLLVIDPSPQLSAIVSRLKEELSWRIGSFSGRNTVPHITLFFADLPAECERDICEGVARGVTGHKGFTLHYNGIKHFPDSKRTIYIDPVEKDLIAPVRQSIVDHVLAFPRVRKAIRPTDHPHLTIAAGLKPAQFRTAWEFLAPHEHASEERVTEVLLLKRLLTSGTQYEKVRSFPLE
jgi:2'-5' RNA ligase